MAAKIKPMTYQDYMHKTEKSKTQTTRILSAKDRTQTTFSSTPSFMKRPTTAPEKVQPKKPKLQNFVNEIPDIDPDDSLLQDSQASKTREQKQFILECQRNERKIKAKQEARLKKEEQERRLKNLKDLSQRFKVQVKTPLQLEKQRKSKERSQERSLKRKTAELVKKHAPTVKPESAVKQLSELRVWIDEQIKLEKLDESNLDSESQVSEKEKENKKMPGNKLLSEKEDAKLGVRTNRYGVFGETDFDKVVQIQSNKSLPVQKQVEYTEQDQKNVRKHVGDVLDKISKKIGVKPMNDNQEVDHVPVKQEPVEKSKSKSRKVVNQIAIKEEKPELPGIVNVRTTQAKLQEERKILESRAVLVIQKFLRGFWGRKETKQKKLNLYKQNAAEYDKFDREIKNNRQYDLNRYLKDKQKIRAQNGFDDVIEESIQEEQSAKFVSTAMSARLSQMFASTQSSEYDPFSLISIYAKRHSQPPKIVKEDKKTILKKQDVIEESIQYSQSFEKASISEDIPKASTSSVKNKQSITEDIPSVKQSTSKSIQDSIKSVPQSISDDIPLAKPDISDVSEISEESFLKQDLKKDNFKLNNAQNQLEARNKQRLGLPLDADKKTVVIETFKAETDVKKNNAVSGLLQELKEYERASLSQIMIDRIEKIVVSALAQKDQLIMGQRLAELERENRHKEEINMIRQEQIKLMSQLMLLGSTQQSNITPKQRDEMLESIQKIVEKPIEIKHETHVTYKMPQSQTVQQQHVALGDPQQNASSFKQTKKQSYLEEYDNRNKFSNQKQSKPQDDISDEIGSQYSIQESIESSRQNIFQTNAYDEFKQKQFKLATDDSQAMQTLLIHMDKAIEQERNLREDNLQQNLRKKQISPRTFQRKREDVASWVRSEREEAKNQLKKLQSKNIDDKKDNQAIQQVKNVDKTPESPDSKYVQRKKEAAQKLINEKEKIIQEQLNQKLKGLEVDLANEELQKALELDVDREVQKRYEIAKKQIEESGGLESSRSGKIKKNVQFHQDTKIERDKISSSGDIIEESIPESIGSQISASQSASKQSASKQSKVKESDENYSSENFDSEESNKLLNSRQKLQNKVKELAESGNYSDDFDDKSEDKMEPVSEEKSESLPSEDVEITNSHMSVEWQIQCAESQESKSDSLNQRISEQQLESNPEEISEAEDDFALADKIAKEFLDLLIQDYKEDQIYVVSKDQTPVDEAQFKDKFPYTLDKVEPEKPMIVNKPISNAKAPQKVLNAKEISDKKFLQKHEQEQKQLKQQQQQLQDFLNFICQRVDIQNLMQQLDTPVHQDPMLVLAQIQAYEDEEPPELPETEMQQVLQQSFFNKVDREFCSFNRQKMNINDDDITVSQDDREKIQNVHNYATFEALNEALDYERPYKTKGQPMPWSKNTRTVKKQTTYENAVQILERAKNKVIQWSQFGAGSKFAPLPPPPTQTQDEFGEEIQQPPLQDGEEERRNNFRQEKLGHLMTEDIKETDNNWVEYEIEETQVQFDLADMILADLAAEICQFLK